jgi:hypothetical protein
MKTLEIIFSLVAAILTVLVTYKWKEIDLFGRVTLIVIIIAAILVAVNSFRDTRKEALIERVNAKFGEIKTNNAKRMEIKLGDKDWATSFVSINGVFDILYNGTFIKLEYENKNC